MGIEKIVISERLLNESVFSLVDIDPKSLKNEFVIRPRFKKDPSFLGVTFNNYDLRITNKGIIKSVYLIYVDRLLNDTLRKIVDSYGEPKHCYVFGALIEYEKHDGGFSQGSSKTYEMNNVSIYEKPNYIKWILADFEIEVWIRKHEDTDYTTIDIRSEDALKVLSDINNVM